MANDNIFSGLKVVDLASFIAGPGAAVILSDFGAEVIKVEPPSGDYWRHGNKIPPQPLRRMPINGISTIATSAAWRAISNLPAPSRS
jgi:crotonobetainyl-CoA:carnitine CoA-transferase CaiB-like acyl-CoA transferase